MAQENLSSVIDSSLYASFFENLKQWCGNLQYKTKIRDHDYTEKDLPPFLDIAKDEFNPLEYYTYYLGSYINHMLRPNHIFLKYILSFPVTYERNIHERMIKAFRAGVLKSLPTALLANEEAMNDFQLVEGTSEPAAYAITALDGFGFLNGEDTDGIYYAVFDFGGGTTDFDFGVLKLAEDDDADFYDYVLTHFGAHGDRTLGGENLLRFMAFQIFRTNSDQLLKPRPDNPEVKIPFTWAAEQMEFAGSEALIRSSQEANLNMHNLMEALRPIWETPDSDDTKKILASGTITLTLFDDTGKDIPEFNLSIGAQIPIENNINTNDIDEDEEETSEPVPKVETKQAAPLVDVEGILRGRISRGIAALSDVTKIKIFLAGNSTKSALVNKLFAEYTDTQAGKARELLGFGKGQAMSRFVLYPPLGTDAADKLQEEKGVAVNRKDFARPTGKTGVAFGLLRCREGSAIRVVDITPEGKDKKQVPFQFYIGRARMGKFTIVIDKATKLGKWYKFIGAKLGVADLLYTDDSRAHCQTPEKIRREALAQLKKPTTLMAIGLDDINRKIATADEKLLQLKAASPEGGEAPKLLSGRGNFDDKGRWILIPAKASTPDSTEDTDSPSDPDGDTSERFAKIIKSDLDKKAAGENDFTKALVVSAYTGRELANPMEKMNSSFA